MKQTGRNSIRVLVVDDEEEILELYQKVLQEPSRARSPKRMGQLAAQLFGRKVDDTEELLRFELTFARQANDAIRQVERSIQEKNPFALIFMDVRMPPGGDGVYAAEAIRRMEPYVEIVLVTGFSDLDPREISRKVPPIDKLLYLEKPFMPAEIRHFACSLGVKWQTEGELRQIKTDLERLITSRTHELEETNKKLRAQLTKHEREEMFRNLRGSVLERIANGESLIRVTDALFSGIQQFRSDLVFVLLLPSRDDKVLNPLHSGLPDELMDALSCPIEPAGDCFGKVAATRVALPFLPINTETRHIPLCYVAEQDGLMGYGAWPILAAETRLVGVLGVFYGEAHALTDYESQVVASAAQLLAIAIAQNEAKTQIQQLSAAIDQNPIGVMLTSPTGRIEYVNARCCVMMSAEPSHFLGRDLDEVLGEANYDIVRHRHLAMAHHETWSAELSQTIGDRSFQERVVVSPILSPDGIVTNLLVMREDISERVLEQEERHQLEARLVQAHKLETIGTLAGGIAHDFNNMLTPILGYVEMAMAEVPKDSEVAGWLTHVLKASGRARELVQQMLTFSRRNQSEREAVNLSLVMDEALKVVRANLPPSIKLKLDIDEHVGMVKANPSQLIQVVVNLAANGKHAMRANGGTLTISLRKVARAEIRDAEVSQLDAPFYARLDVADTGTGISPEVQARIFEPFFTTKGTGEGTGLGLSVVHGVVFSHKGDIEFVTEDGVGTTFTVFLPLTVSTAPIAVEEPDARKVDHILFVDDEEIIVHMTKGMLERQGFKVTAFTDPREVLKIFNQAPQEYDLLITDQTMPFMSGVALSQHIRHIRKDLPIILLTGFSETVSEDNCEDLGIREFLMKPMSTQELVRAIRKVLDRG